MFIIGKILAALLFPPGLFILIVIFALFLALRGRRRLSFIIASVDAIIIYMLSTCAFSNLIILPLENCYPALFSRAGAESIVVLGGGYIDNSPEYAGIGALAPVSEKRAIYGLELARRYNLPLVFSGGSSFDSKEKGTEAEAAERLWVSLGADKSLIRIETASKDTKANAAGVAALIGTKPVLLVTSASHMPRAMLSFIKAGIPAIAAPTDFHGKRTKLSWADFLPDSSRLNDTRMALHEYIGLLYYRLTL